MRVLLLLFLLPVISCSDNMVSDMSDSECESILVDVDLFEANQNSIVNFQEATIQDDCLTVTVGLSGCDDDHTIDMITDGIVNYTNPPSIEFLFRDNQIQLCEAYFLVEYSFDLNSFSDILKQRPLLLKFANSDKTFLLE